MTTTYVTPAEEVAAQTTLHDLAKRAGLRLERIVLPNFELYAVYKKEELFYTVFCEQYDQPKQWEARPGAQKQAMIVLAMDEWEMYNIAG